jgi:hypothetical protein
LCFMGVWIRLVMKIEFKTTTSRIVGKVLSLSLSLSLSLCFIL